ncbi:hypothetical protein HDU84_008764 [Entophlyctis sp. JEL0112]|nr:hypothetical protein HDU84_008764 [Entophlyctis sp. JEL0112]
MSSSTEMKKSGQFWWQINLTLQRSDKVNDFTPSLIERNDTEVTREEGEQLALNNDLLFVETSAKSGENVAGAFLGITGAIYESLGLDSGRDVGSFTDAEVRRLEAHGVKFGPRRAAIPGDSAAAGVHAGSTGKTLGQGSYATVKEAVKITTGEHFAVKVISKKLMAGREHLILNEIEILKKVSKGNHHIVTLHDYFETPNNLYLVMDLCTGGELFDRIVERGSFFEEDAAEIIRTVLEAVAYLHSQNIVHRDIKPENLLFKAKDSNELVIADFGLSKIADGEALNNLKTLCGTPGYMAPEVILKSGHGKSVDLWSIGVMTYFLLCGYTPFDGQGSSEDMERILTANYAFEPIEYWTDISEKGALDCRLLGTYQSTAQDFIRRTIIVDPARRMTAMEALRHPWILEYAPGAIDDQQVGRVPTKDLLPDVKRRITGTKSKLRGAVDAVRAATRMSHLSTKGSGGSNGSGGATPMEIERSSFHPTEEHDLMVLTR